MFEAYTVAVRVSLRGAHQFTTSLMGIAAAFNKVHGNAKALQGTLNKIKFSLIAGTAFTGAGLLGLAAFKAPLEHAKAYNHELQMLAAAGVKQRDIAMAVKAAWGTVQSVPTTTAEANLKAIGELRTVFGNYGGQAAIAHAIQVLPTVQRLNYLLDNALDERGEKLHWGGQAYIVAKALEKRGATQDPQRFESEANMMAQAIVASRGRVRPQDFLSAVIYGRRAAYSWDPQFMYRVLPTLIQEMQGTGSGGGGVRGPGNALMSAYAAVVGGVVPAKTIPTWMKLGLVDPKKVQYAKNGTPKSLMPEAIYGWQTFQHDPRAWADQFLAPALAKHGITGQDKTRAYMQSLFPNRTASIMDEFILQPWKFARDIPLFEQAKNLRSAYGQMVKQDPYAADAMARAGLVNVMTQIGIQILPTVVSMTQKFASGLRDLIGVMQKHPTVVKGLVFAFAGLSILSVIAGGVLLFSGALMAVELALTIGLPALGALAVGIMAFVGPVLLAVAAAAALALGLAWLSKHWRQVWADMKSVASAAWSNLTAKFSALWKVIQDTATTSWASLKNGFLNFFHTILQWVRDHLPNFMDGPAAPGSGGSPGHPRRPVHPAALVGGTPGRSGVIAPLHVQNVSNVTVPVHLDGRKIAEVTASHLSRAVGYQNALGRHDPTATLAAAGAGYET